MIPVAEKFRNYPILDDVYQAEFHQRRLSMKWSRVHPGETVVSVGCNGGHEVQFAPSGCQVHGVDISEPALALARTRLASATYGFDYDLPFEDKSADVVMLGNILMYVPDPAATFAEARRVARRSVIGSTAHEDGPWGRALLDGKSHEWNVRYLRVEELCHLLAAGSSYRFSVEFLMVGSQPYFTIFETELL